MQRVRRVLRLSVLAAGRPRPEIALLAAAAAALLARTGVAQDGDELRRNRLAVLARDAKDASDRRRLAAWEELLEHGPDGERILRPIVSARLQRHRDELAEHFKGTDLSRARRKVEEALIARREEALACIFDPKRYPDEDHGVVGQPEVDRLVERVSAAFDHPATFAREVIEDVEATAAALEEDLVYLEACGGAAPADMPTVAEWLGSFDAAFEVERLGINGTQHDWNVAVAKYHQEELLTSADAEERACMDATNAYRLKMGRPILEIDERLVRAARKHSLEMKELGYFAHESPVPENRWPGMRCAAEGYPGGGAENISGAPSGVGAFWSWYRSSGHHRNMLGGHRQIGIGRAGELPGELFTQNFGGSSSLRGRVIEDPQILYLGRLKRLDPADADSEAALAAWCRSQRLEERCREHALRALALDPDHAKARELLGHKKVDGRWVEPAVGATSGSGIGAKERRPR